MFICVGLWKKRYQRRIHMLVTVFASNLFKGNPVVWELILSCVNAAFSGGMTILGSFFDLDGAPLNKDWITEFRRFRKLRGRIKSLPFRVNSCDLLPIVHSDAANDDLLLTVSDLPKEIAALPVSSRVKALLVFDPRLGRTEQRQIVYDLEDTIDCQGENLLTTKQKVKTVEEEPPLPNPRTIHPSVRFRYRSIVGAVKTFDEECSAQSETLNSVFLERTAEVMEAVKATPHIGVNMELLKMFARAPTFSIRSRKVIRQRGKLRDGAMAVAASDILGIIHPVREILSDQILRVNPLTMFTKPSILEDALMDIIDNSGTFHVGRSLVANFLIADTVEKLKSAIQGLSAGLVTLVKIFNEQFRSVLYNALIRVHFDMVYSRKSILVSYSRADLEFMRRAEAFAKKPVSSLNLPTTMIAREVHRMPIMKYFGTSKLVQVTGLAFLVNPLDMLQLISQAVASVVGFFSRGKLTPEETKTAFLALVARGPPPNAIGVLRFLETWDGLQLSAELDRAKGHYKDAVTSIFPPNDIRST
jgi:hypothetical protein